MSFNHKEFSVMAYSNGFTFWKYATKDTVPTLKKSGYFNTISPFARVGDLIFATADKESSVASVILAVSKIENDTVTVSSLVK